MKEEGLVNTENEKIFIGKPESIEFKMLLKSLEYLSLVISDNDNTALREAIKNLVPTYQLSHETNRKFMNKIDKKELDRELIL